MRERTVILLYVTTSLVMRLACSALKLVDANRVLRDHQLSLIISSSYLLQKTSKTGEVVCY